MSARNSKVNKSKTRHAKPQTIRFSSKKRKDVSELTDQDEAFDRFHELEDQGAFEGNPEEAVALRDRAEEQGWTELQSDLETKLGSNKEYITSQIDRIMANPGSEDPDELRTLLDTVQEQGWDDLEDRLLPALRRLEDDRDDSALIREPTNTIGRKISDETLAQDINDTLDKVGVNFETRDVLEKLANDFEVPLSPTDNEQQVLNKLKKDRLISQDNYDFINDRVNTIKTQRKRPDDLLQESIDNVKVQSIEQEYSVKAILEELARDLETNILPTDTEQDILRKLVNGRVINLPDYDFIAANTDERIGRLRADAKGEADEIANARIAEKIRQREQAAEREKSDLLREKEAEALRGLSRTHKNGLKQPEGSDKYRKAKKALDDATKARYDQAAEDIDRRLEADIRRLRTTSLDAEKKQQYKDFGDFLKNTNYDPFSFDALATAGNFREAEQLVALINRKPNLRVLATPQYYNLLNNTLHVPAGEDTTDAIMQRIDPETWAQFARRGEDGLVFLRELDNKGGITDDKLRDVSRQITEIAPLVSWLDAQRNFADLLVNDSVEDILNLAKELDRLNIDQRINVLQTLRPHAVDADALREGLQLANRLGWPIKQIQNRLTALPPPGGAQDIRNHIHANALSVFNKNTQFAAWIKSLNLLMEEAGHTIKASPSYPLSGGNTIERNVDIYDAGGTYKDKFVIHYHPGAASAAVSAPSASDKHIKPERGNAQTRRLYWDGSIPDTLKENLPAKY